MKRDKNQMAEAIVYGLPPTGGSNGGSQLPVLPQRKHQDGGKFDVRSGNEPFKGGPIDPPGKGGYAVNLVNLNPNIVVQHVKINNGNWMELDAAIGQTCKETDWTKCWEGTGRAQPLCGVNIGSSGESIMIYIAYSRPGGPLQIAPLATPLTPDTDYDDAMTYIPGS